MEGIDPNKMMSPNNATEVDDDLAVIALAKVLQLPEASKETLTVDSQTIAFFQTSLAKIGELSAAHPKLVFSQFHKILSFCLNLLDLKVAEGQVSGPPTDPSTALAPLKLTFNLRPREENELKEKALKTIHTLIQSTKKSKVFSYWFVFLPGCSRLSPYKVGLFDLLHSPDDSIRQIVFNIVQNFFEGSSNFLLLANAHCRTSSYTPVCYEFAESLYGHVDSVVKFLNSKTFMEPQWASLISRTLVVMLDHIPFHKLHNGLLSSMAERVLKLSPAANPVIQIAVLQICSALLSITPPHPEVKVYFNGFLQLFLSRSFCIDALHDNNIRYVALQDLGKLANLDLDALLQNMPSIVKNFDQALKDKDQSITLHVLRLIKTVSKASATEVSKYPSDTVTPIVEKTIKFWLEILKPGFLGPLESKDSNIVRAAFCDCLSEIGDVILTRLPTEKRNLIVSYLLRQCRDSDHRVVASAFRGIGMVVILRACQSDYLFLADCADILIEAFHSNQSGVHRNTALSGTWAMANLADTLAKQHSQVTPDCDLSKENSAIEFPPHLLLPLVRISINYSKPDSQSHMNTRANCMRALGSLIQCFDSMASKGFPGGGSEGLVFIISSQHELQDLCFQVVDTLVRAISSDKVMKVRWNACYAAGGILKTTLLYASDTTGQRLSIIDALLPLIENFQNFKVRINAAHALRCIERRSVLGPRFQECCLSVAKALDTAHLLEGEPEEIQHKTDLVDQLCLTFCHLVSLGDVNDFVLLNNVLSGYTDVLNQSLKTVSMRISPEKFSTFIETKRQLVQNISPSHLTKSENLLEIFSGLDTFICG